MKANENDKRRISGFTMAEMLAVIAVMAVVAGLVIVGVTQYMRSTYQREMDETAKEIYVAAQNHLVVAEGLGAMSGRTAGMDNDHKDTGAANSGDTYYFVVGEGGSDRRYFDNKKSMLSAMLPQGSIDESVRSDGSYIIRYKYSNSRATVLDVFYADPNEQRFPSYPYTFTEEGDEGDFSTLFGDSMYTDTGDAGKRARADYNGAIIGYYGGDGASMSATDVAAPKLNVTNAEKLTATIANASSFRNEKLELYIFGKESKAKYGPVSMASLNSTFVIDDITTANGHFANLNTMSFQGGALMTDEEFIPGEDITVQAFALGIDEISVKRSAKRSTNSLFASVSMVSARDLADGELNTIVDRMSASASNAGTGLSTQAQAAPATRYAKVANIRHLENLDKDVSGYDSSCVAKLGNRAPSVYKQVADLSWADFRKKVVGMKEGADGSLPDDTAASLAVRVYDIRGYATAPGSYAPVTPDARLNVVYEGNSHAVSDVVVSEGDMAGLFGQLENAEVSNLDLVNFNLGGARDVGGLAGKAVSSRVSGVLVRNVVSGGTDAAYELASSSGSAGGLIGALEGESSVSGCAAAVYVRTGGNDAGGLIGYMSGTASLSDSYAAGHTTGGTYLATTGAGTAGRVNVVSAGRSAGGLVGISFADATIRSCYSTCSVQGGSNVGGLVGWMYSSGAITNCYATGLVQAGADGASLGGFAGAMGGMRQVEDNRYFDIVNSGRSIGAVGAGSSAGITAFDEDTAAYNGFATGAGAAYPYDAALPGTYPFKTVAELDEGYASAVSESGLTAHLTAHYGDWPTPETLVVNVPG